MRKTLGIGAALLALAAAIGGIEAGRHAGGAPDFAPASRSATPTAFAAVVQPANAAAESPSPAQRDADLPSVEVKPYIVHTAPGEDGTLPARPVTFQQRDPRVVERSTPLPPRRPHATAVALDPATLGGAARPVSGPILSIAGRTVHLFGLRAADARERCAPGRGAAASCADAASAALAARFSANPSVTCTMPPGQGDDPGFVCRDSAGVDLGGLLVAQGLALVDRRSSYQYVGEEDTARASRRGLWRYR